MGLRFLRYEMITRVFAWVFVLGWLCGPPVEAELVKVGAGGVSGLVPPIQASNQGEKGVVTLNADFDVDVISGTIPLIVQFTNRSTSTGADIGAYAWDLDGDGVIDSVAENPQFTYVDPGTISVSLTVSSDEVSDTLSLVDLITVHDYSYPGAIHHVDQGALGAADGTSWANAFPGLQDALDVAQAGDQIWVASGTYTPTRRSDPATPRSETFFLVDGVGLFGGFAGTETARDERNWELNTTTLSGEIGHLGADDNCLHIVQATDVGRSTVVDGFTVSGGNAFSDASSSAGQSGGGFLGTGNFMLRNMVFSNNAGWRGGGANIGSVGDRPVLASVRFENNSAKIGGGAYSSTANLHFIDAVFVENSAGGLGGGAFLLQPFIRNSRFYRNTGGTGAGVYSRGGGTFLHVEFIENSASSEGGGFYTRSKNFLYDVQFSGNTAIFGGGLMMNTGDGGRIEAAMFEGNAANNIAGGLWGSGSMANAYIGRNLAGSEGGGMRWSGTLRDVVVEENTVGFASGGGMILHSGERPTVVVNARIQNNSAAQGGGISLTGSGSGYVLQNIILVGNHASEYGGGIRAAYNHFRINNVTLVNNSAGLEGGGLHILQPDPGSVVSNNIFWDNFLSDGSLSEVVIADLPTHVTVSDNVIAGGFSGVSNVSTDPLFVDSANGLFELLAGSPAINTGSNALLTPDYSDMDQDANSYEPTPLDAGGRSRILGGVIDRGAFEFFPDNTTPVIFADFAADSTEVAAPADVHFSSFAGAFHTMLTSWSWDFDDDGVVDSNEEHPTHRYLAPGVYSVSLTVSDGILTSTHRKDNYVTVVPGDPQVQASFTSSSSTGSAPLSVQFNNASAAFNTTITSYAWDFDGDSVIDSTQENPTFLFSEVGTYSVSLTVSDGTIADTATQVLEILGLVAHWPFNENGGCQALDVTGQHSGALGPDCSTNSPQWVPGQSESALLFNGLSHSVAVAAAPDIDSLSALTLSAWIRHPPTTDYRPMVDKRDGAQDGYDLYIDPDSALFVRINEHTLRSQTAVADGTWHHVATTYDGTNLRVYVDGTLEASEAIGSTFIQTSSPLYMGRHFQDENLSLAGTLDEVYLYNHALSDAEIANLAEGPGTEPATIEAEFSSSIQSGTAPLSVHFQNLSVATGTVISHIAWDFDNDGVVDSTDEHPTHVYPAAGIYTVSLTISDGTLSDSEIKSGYITVQEAGSVAANFTADLTGGPAPLTVQFTDQSTAQQTTLTSFAWDFDGDGLIDSNQQHPTYVYGNPGLYSVTLTVSDGTLSDSRTRSDWILVTPPNEALPATGYWPLDEGAGGIAGDHSGNGNDAIAASTDLWQAFGQVQGSMLFNGVDEYLTIQDQGIDWDLDLESTGSLALWVKPEAFGARQALISKDGSYEFEFGDATDQAYSVKLNNLRIGRGATPLKAHLWQHLAVTWDGSEVQYFYNGQPDGTVSFSETLVENSHDIGIGARVSPIWAGGPTFLFAGSLDEVRIYGQALSVSEIHEVFQTGSPDVTAPQRSAGLPRGHVATGMTPVAISMATNEMAQCRYSPSAGTDFHQMTESLTSSDGLHHQTLVDILNDGIYEFHVRCADGVENANASDYTIRFGVSPSLDLTSDLAVDWAMDEGAGCQVGNGQGSLGPGTLGPSCPSNTAQWVPGFTQGGLQFDGSDDAVTGDVVSFGPDHQLTLMAWIQHASTSQYRSIADQRDQGTEGYDLYLTPSSKLLLRINGVTLESQRVVADGQWHHVVGVYDGLELRLYVDGILDSFVVAPSESLTLANPLVVGRHFSGSTNYSFQGIMDSFKLYTRALTDVEILALAEDD